MITKADVINRILDGRQAMAGRPEADVFAPANIALCKYWGKRDTELNLPMTDSLSLSLGSLGSRCRLGLAAGDRDEVAHTGESLAGDHPFVMRLSAFLDLFRGTARHHYRVDTTNTIPTAAGFASSASGFAALVNALDQLHGWALPARERSILARLGSGSASRSLWQGFVIWHAGNDADGMDSFAEPLAVQWPDLRIGLLVVNSGKKSIGSTVAMRRTVETSALYAAWPSKVAGDLAEIRQAISSRDIDALGNAAESNALAMHATMMAARPPVLYWQESSLAAMRQVWEARQEGLPVYFTMDAGPNLKLLFLENDRASVIERFPITCC